MFFIIILLLLLSPMHSEPNMPPLQLVSIFLLLSPLFSIALVVKPGCHDQCGDLPIPYPFGVGSDCSHDPYFNITCNSSTDPPKAYLSIMNIEVVEINQTYIRVKYPTLISASCDFSGIGINVTGDELYKHSKSVNLSGTPYTLSYGNRLTAIGCDDMLLQSNGSSVGSGCSAICTGKNDTGGVGYCPISPKVTAQPFNGCCQTDITEGTSYLGAQLIDLSGKIGRRKLFPCSYAFIQERWSPNETVFSYPLHYLHNSTAFLNDNWASTPRPPVVRLDWIVGAENCSRAKLNSATYGCRDDKSVCVDVDSDFYPYPPRGYLCSCVQGYEGNPYLPGGCQTISFSSSIAKFGCHDQCGTLSIPFPFGVGPNCFLEPSFEIICNTATNFPRPYLAILNKEIIELNSSKVVVKYPNLGWTCYNLSDHQVGISKTEKRSLIIDLLKSRYSISNGNWITAVGCSDMVVAVIGKDDRSSIGSICTASCSNEQNRFNYVGECQYGMDRVQDGCCSAPIPRGATYLEAKLTELSGQWPRININVSCSYAFLQYLEDDDVYNIKHDTTYGVDYPFLQNSTGITPDALLPDYDAEYRRLSLDWRIGAVNCKEARRDPDNFACQANADCIDFDATAVKGYLCRCSKGYQGNPYLTPGCQDIDECADNATNTCNSNSTCINNLGSYQCSCPKGYFGDGGKDGTGCIQLPPDKSKTIILIGLGSGLGFLLLLVMCYWLYKVLQKRKVKMAKEKFFKRNGGLLLRQQTNEGALGKTKVFPAKELELATDHFNESRIIGHGGQGTVYKGMLSDGKIVAIKKSKLVEENQLEQFINEVAILSQINHRNVVRLLGCCLETEVPLLVYEYMPNGTLFELIHDPNNEFPFPWSMRLKIAADIAGALAYLHSASSMPIYHRDIKSSNLLLDEKYVVKVSDFGTSRSVAADQTHLTTMVKGTFGYLDPEYFQSSQFTEKSDVYSFGVVLVELLSGQRPISFDKTEEERGLATRFLTCMDENCLDTILDPQVSEQGRMEEVILVARLAQRCLNLKGRMRPTMKEVATELESFRISQMSAGVKDESEDVRGFEDMPTSISDNDYTWTGSGKSVGATLSDTYPLIYQE